ncbi:hypothetical protein SRABI106_01788 [Rahnella aquatilis]|nr:hypothetical protein SRABI106_01788 [Rahnella aquatilis]
MDCQILRMLRRTLRGQISRRRADDRRTQRQWPGDQVRIQIVCDAQRQIDPVFHQIDRPAFQLKIDTDLRMSAQKFTDRNHHRTLPERL